VHQGVYAHPGDGLHVAEVVPHGEHDDPGVGRGLAQPLDDLLGGLQLHVQLRDDDVGLGLADPLRGLVARGGGTHHLHPFAGGEEGLQAHPEHGVVVGEVHTYGHSVLSFRMNGPCQEAHTEVAHRSMVSTVISPKLTTPFK
jgi:hypothetical protein